MSSFSDFSLPEFRFTPKLIWNISGSFLIISKESKEVLPQTVYMLVEKNEELEPRHLKDYPELAANGADDKEKKDKCLLDSPINLGFITFTLWNKKLGL